MADPIKALSTLVPNINTGNLSIQMPKTLSKVPVKTPNSFNFNMPDGSLLRAGAGLLSGWQTASNLEDNISTRVPTAAPFTYTNRSGFLRHQNRATARGILNNRRGLPINEQQVLASTLEADNAAGLAEAERQDRAIDNYNNRNLQLDAMGVVAINRNNYYNNMLRNAKTVAKGDAFTSFLSNLNTIEADNRKAERDKKALQAMYKGFLTGNKGLDKTLKEIGLG